MIYVLHFDPPYRHAGHYVGWTKDADVTRRVREHLEQTGRRPSRLVAAAIGAGCVIRLAASFEGSIEDEQRIKKGHGAKRICPICKGEYNARSAARMRARRHQ